MGAELYLPPPSAVYWNICLLPYYLFLIFHETIIISRETWGTVGPSANHDMTIRHLFPRCKATILITVAEINRRLGSLGRPKHVFYSKGDRPSLRVDARSGILLAHMARIFVFSFSNAQSWWR